MSNHRQSPHYRSQCAREAGAAPARDSVADDIAAHARLARLVETFSPRMRQVLDFLSEGHSNKSIAWRMSISQSSVKWHVTRIIKAFGCTNRTQAALIAFSVASNSPSRVARIGFKIPAKSAAFCNAPDADMDDPNPSKQ